MLESNTVHMITARFSPNNADMCVCVCVYTTDSCQCLIHMCVTLCTWCVATMSNIPQMIMCSIACLMYRCKLGAPKPSRLLCSLYDINIGIALEVVWLKVFSVNVATQRYKILHSCFFFSRSCDHASNAIFLI